MVIPPEIQAAIGQAVGWLWAGYGQKVIEKGATFAKNQAQWQWSIEKYYTSLYEKVGFVLILGRREAEPLENVFTHVNVLDRLSAERRYTVERLMEEAAPRDFDWHRRVKRLSGDGAVAKYPKLFILGKPGAGKTTFLKHTALRAIRHEIKKVPIFVSLKELSDSGMGLLDFIVHQFAVHRFPNPAPFVEDLLKDGAGLLLFDGLDEVNLEGERRATLIAQLNDFVYQYSDCPMLLTCRVAATDYSFTQFEYVEMADFDTEQMGRYIDFWFVRDEVKRDNCRRALLEEESNKGVRELAQVPLLLSLLCLVYDERNEFPPNRDEIYEEALRALLLKWDASRNIARDKIYAELSYKHKLRLLTYVAADTFEKGEYFLPEKRVVGLLEDYLARVPGVTEPDGEQVLAAMEAQHGIFVERARRIHSFSHLTLQEYLTARYIVDNEARGTLPRLMAHVGDVRWWEVFLLAAGMLDDATQFCTLYVAALNQVIAGEVAIREVLQWSVDKGMQVARDWQPPTLRAFDLCIFIRALYHDFDHIFALDLDLNLGFSHALDLALDYARTLVLDLTLARTLDSTIDSTRTLALLLDRARTLDLDLSRTLDLDLNLALGFDLTRVLDLDHDFALGLKKVTRNLIETSKKIGRTTLTKALGGLSVPNLEADSETWWQFYDQLQRISIQHHDIGHEWPLSVEQTELLVRYLEATQLFVACLRLATLPDRETFENQLLLPPTPAS